MKVEIEFVRDIVGHDLDTIKQMYKDWSGTQHYPGTRQVCAECGEPTGNCEEDSIYNNNDEPICAESDKKLSPQ